MKKFIKIALNITAVIMATVATFGLAACEDIKKAEINLNLYNASEKTYYAENDVKMSIDFYRHLAPKTVDGVIALINDNYYDGTIFYKDTSYNNQIMIGDLKFVDGKVVKNDKTAKEFYGEFEYNGTSGSNLTSGKGSIGMWRSWYESNTDTYKTNNAMDSGNGTWFIPTSSISGYNGYFCIFAQYDTENTANSIAITALNSIFSSSETYTEYVIYYTGTYDAEKADADFGLTFNAVVADEFDAENVENLFTAEGDQLVCYNQRTVRIPVVGNKVFASINSVKVR